MTVLLVVVGIVPGFIAGWWISRAGRKQRDEQQWRTPVSAGVGIGDVLDGHATGAVIADRDGEIWYRNEAAQRLAGTHSGVLLDAAIDRHLALGRAGERSHETVEFFGPPKQAFDVDARPLPNGGSVAFVQDISERRRADQVRTDFVANVSHELKTPIGALSVLAETLVDEIDPATIRRVVGRMMAETERASHTVDELMELSRIELGGERINETVRVAELVRRAVDRVSEIAVHHGITIEVASSEESGDDTAGPIAVSGDSRQLISAIGNIVENAVKYSEPGSQVTVGTALRRDSVEISVVDHGVGIPQRDLDRIFERFYRVDRARQRSTGGSGLGLSIVRHVVTNHDGEVVVSSTEGEGSTFVVRLPRAHVSVSPGAPAAAVPHPEGVS